jgi:hypothetical protein
VDDDMYTVEMQFVPSDMKTMNWWFQFA